MTGPRVEAIPQQQARSWFRRHRGIIAIVFLSLLVRGAILNRDFIANEEGTVAGIPMVAARNYLRHGLTASRFAAVINTGVVAPEHWVIYAHHPPLTALASSLSMWLCGTDAAGACRAPAALFAILNTILIYALMLRGNSPRRAALIAAVLYAFCPATLAFGDMPDYVNVQVVFFMLLSVEFYARWRETGHKRFLFGLAGAFLLGALTDWPIFYLVPLIGLHFWIRDGFKRGSLRFIPFGVAGTFTLLALGQWWSWAGGDVSLWHQVWLRFHGQHDQGAVEITIWNWIIRVLGLHVTLLHTPMAILLALYWVGVLLRNTDLFRVRPTLIFAWGLVHLLAGKQGNFQHVFWSSIVTPGVAMTAALGVELLLRRVPPFHSNRLRLRLVGAAAGILFAAQSLPLAYHYLFVPYDHLLNPPYTQKMLGETIRQVAAPDEGVITSDYWMECALWYYADRQLIVAVDDSQKLAGLLDSRMYLLPFNYIQHGGPKPRWFVLPRVHRTEFPELATFLDARFPHRQSHGPFDVYQLW